VLLALVPVMAGVTLLVWLAVAYLTRYSSLAAIVAAIFVPFGQLLTYGASPAVLAITVMSLLLVWRHAGNIRKLMAGTESKIGQKAAPVAPPPAPDVHAHGHGHKHSHSHKHHPKGKH
jgi:glycerol-3-phosphate acyltransferase PlsY